MFACIVIANLWLMTEELYPAFAWIAVGVFFAFLVWDER
jgi:FtsH-binding integral membrane protein